MKKTIAFAITASFLVNAIPAVADVTHNSTSKTTQEITKKLHTLQLNVEGKKSNVSYVTKGSKRLLDASTLLPSLGFIKEKKATNSWSTSKVKVTYDELKRKVLINKKQASIQFKYEKNKLYIDPISILKLLKVDYLLEEDGGLFVSNKYTVLSQEAFDAQWVTKNQVIVSVVGENGIQSSLIDTVTKKSTTLPTDFPLVVSPTKDRAVFTDEDGLVYEISLSTMRIRLVSNDIDSKTEITWSADGNSIYYLGDKAKNYYEMKMANGAVSTILKEDMEGKTDLSLSKNKAYATFILSKSGKATEETLPDGSKEISSNDTTGTEPQIYVMDLLTKDAKAEAITSTKSNKEFLKTIGTSKLVYLDIPEDEAQLMKLNVYDTFTKTSTELVSNNNISLVEKLSDSSLLVGLPEAKGITLYKLSVSTKKLTKITTVTDSVVGINILDEQNFALTLDNGNSTYVSVYSNGKINRLSK